MELELRITDQPIAMDRSLPSVLQGQVGAVTEFQGIVRCEENRQPISGLEYEAYAPMAERMLRRIAHDLGLRHGCLFARVTHRIGLVPVGEPALHILVAAAHRTATFAFSAEFMDRLKAEVPIWKCRAVSLADQAIS